MSVERINELEVRLRPPLTDADVRQLKIGDHVLIGPRAYLSGCTVAEGAFLATGAYQDLDRAMPQPLRMLDCIRALEAEDGGYANQRNSGHEGESSDSGEHHRWGPPSGGPSLIVLARAPRFSPSMRARSAPLPPRSRRWRATPSAVPVL